MQKISCGFRFTPLSFTPLNRILESVQRTTDIRPQKGLKLRFCRDYPFFHQCEFSPFGSCDVGRHTLRIEQVRGFDTGQVEPLFDFSDQRLASPEIVAIADDVAVPSNPAGCDVNVVPVTNGKIPIKAHPFRPHSPHFFPFEDRKSTFFLRQRNGHVNHIARQVGAQCYIHPGMFVKRS